MRVIELSDHPGALLRDIRRERGADSRRAQARYAREVADHETRLARARTRREKARASHRWYTLLLTVPNQLGVNYNAHVIESVLTHVAPALGWR
jgi:hypothetical protein